jgi:hypothetical protein
MCVEDFRRLTAAAGGADFRYASIYDLYVVENKVGFATFSSRTTRLFKLNDPEDICED